MKINEIYVALTVAMSVAVTASMVVTLTMTGFDYEGSLLKKNRFIFDILQTYFENFEYIVISLFCI